MNADYEAWRPALIAFYRHESPWMTQKLENLRRGDPLTTDDRHVIDGLIAATRIAA
jgi:hypothetical protein